MYCDILPTASWQPTRRVVSYADAKTRFDFKNVGSSLSFWLHDPGPDASQQRGGQPVSDTGYLSLAQLALLAKPSRECSDESEFGRSLFERPRSR
jgi:DUF438 domain-containing protein